MEADITDTCNLKCKNCAHFSPHFKRNSYTLEEFKADVKQLATAVHVGLFDLLGGEPLLVGSRIVEYVEALRTAGFGVGMITNGILLPRFEHIVPMFDRILISLYATKHAEEIRTWAEERRYPNIDVQERRKFIKVFDPENPRLTEEQAVETFSQCGARRTCNEIYRGRFYRCAPSYKAWTMLRAKGIPHDEPKEIGIDLYAPDLEERIKAYRESETREAACNFCRLRGSIAVWEEWKEER